MKKEALIYAAVMGTTVIAAGAYVYYAGIVGIQEAVEKGSEPTPPKEAMGQGGKETIQPVDYSYLRPKTTPTVPPPPPQPQMSQYTVPPIRTIPAPTNSAPKWKRESLTFGQRDETTDQQSVTPAQSGAGGTAQSQNPHRAFLASVSAGAPGMLQGPRGEFSISMSRMIPAVAVNAASTRQPGMLFGMVTYDVMDDTGRCVMIPAGSIIRNQVNSSVGQFERHMQAAADSITMSTTRATLSLGAMPATGTDGAAGLPGRVNAHNGQLMLALFADAALTAIGQVGQIANGGGGNTIVGIGAGSIAGSASSVGGELVRRNLDRQNTIDIKIGDPVPFVVTEPLYFDPQGDCIR